MRRLKNIIADTAALADCNIPASRRRRAGLRSIQMKANPDTLAEMLFDLLKKLRPPLSIVSKIPARRSGTGVPPVSFWESVLTYAGEMPVPLVAQRFMFRCVRGFLNKFPTQYIFATGVLTVFFAALASNAFAADTWKPGSGWKLAWSDEFTDPALNTNNWTFDLGAGGWGNNEFERYTTTNAYLQNGDLVIAAIKHGSNDYTSARLKTQGLRSWKYGKIAARMRLPSGQGIWPAFWMLGTNITSVGWPKCGEIDIMEMIGGGEDRDDTVHGTMHWDLKNSHTSSGGSRELPDPQVFSERYHVFEIEWNDKSIIWRLDGREYFHANVDTKEFPDRAEFHQPFFILLNLAVGGNWPGNPNSTTVFPRYLRVDWVRVYQRASNSKSEVSGKRFSLRWSNSAAGKMPCRQPNLHSPAECSTVINAVVNQRTEWDAPDRPRTHRRC